MNYSVLTLQILRISVSGIFMAHGIIRIANGTVGGFGEFLDGKGFMIGVVIAWGVTMFEIVGGSLMALGKWIQPISIAFIVHQAFGVLLVHAKNGWFVVGPGTGGMEYSALLIISLLVITTGRK